MIRLLEPGSLRSVPYYVIPRLRKGGYHTFQAVANASIRDIVYYSSLSRDKAKLIHRQCRETKVLENAFEHSVLNNPWISFVELVELDHVEENEAVPNNLVTA